MFSWFAHFVTFSAFFNHTPLLSSASHNFWFWSSGLAWRLQNLPSQDRYSLRQAKIEKTLRPGGFPAESLGIYHVGFCFSGVQIFLCYWYVCHDLIIRYSCSVSFICLYSRSRYFSSVDFNLLLVFVSCVLHNLWIFNKPRPPLFPGRYNFVIDDLGWRQRNYLVIFL